MVIANSVGEGIMFDAVGRRGFQATGIVSSATFGGADARAGVQRFFAGRRGRVPRHAQPFRSDIEQFDRDRNQVPAAAPPFGYGKANGDIARRRDHGHWH
jgi:hypothetical protein